MPFLSGRCLCGKVKFTYDGPVGEASYCHCEDCRRCTGSAFNVSVQVDKACLVFSDRSALGVFEYTADSGREMQRMYCKSCGSPIMTIHPHIPSSAWIKAGIIDQIDMVHPVHESWTSVKVPWASIKVPSSSEGNR